MIYSVSGRGSPKVEWKQMCYNQVYLIDIDECQL